MRIWTCPQAGECSCHLQLPPCRAGWSSQRGRQAAGYPAMVTSSNLHWLNFFHRWRIHGKPQSTTSGTIDPPTMANPQSESCMQLGNSETKVFWYREKSPGALQCSFCGPHIQLRVHITASGGRCFSGLQLAPLPPQPNASTSARACMKEAFQRKQTNPVTPDKRLQ